MSNLHPQPGLVVDGKYQLIKPLGSGGMGTVYLARSLNLERDVVVKFLGEEFAKVASGMEHFRRELDAAARLQHPNVVAIYDYGRTETAGASAYVVTEFVDDLSLSKFMQWHRESDPDSSIIRAMRDICAGVGAAHELSLIHTDLKLDNILLAKRYFTPKVLNFGTARLRYQMARETSEGAIVGTPQYMSPEQCQGKSLDPRSDVYSLGVIFYEMLAGQPPFEAQTVAGLIAKHLTEAPPPLPWNRRINQEVEVAIFRALSKDPDDRQPNANAFAEEIEEPLRGSSYSDEPIKRETEGESPKVSAATGKRPEVPVPREAERKTERPIYLDENVQFTVYRPKTIAPQKWYAMLAFAHLSERPPHAPEDEPDPIAQMEEEAARLLGQQIENYRDLTVDSSQAVPRSGEITFVPSAEGIEFNPLSRTFIWQESVHREEFRLRATQVTGGRTARGRLSVFLGPILLAEITLSIRVDSSQASQSPQKEKTSAQPYRKIFPSYSHADRSIVEQIEHYAQISGDKYLRDITELRSGQDWKLWMKKTINGADIFQLFWSRNSMRSQYVREEWEYALSLRREHFIRPTYWETPLPESPEEGLPPEALRSLHFQHVRPLISTHFPPTVGSPTASHDLYATMPATPRATPRATPPATAGGPMAAPTITIPEYPIPNSAPAASPSRRQVNTGDLLGHRETAGAGASGDWPASPDESVGAGASGGWSTSPQKSMALILPAVFLLLLLIVGYVIYRLL
jgi:serine/threonine protein kinase